MPTPPGPPSGHRPLISGFRGCLLVVLILIGSFAAAGVFLNWFDRKPVVGPLPPSFAVIALAAPTAGASPVPYLVSGETLDRFRKEHPDHSFLLPADRVREVGEGLQDGDRQYAEGLHLQGLDVDAAGSGRQRVEINAPWHSDVTNLCVYETSGRDVVPLYTRTQHSLVEVMRLLTLGGALTLVMLAIIAVAERIRLRNKAAAVRRAPG